jgi:hypothetical protein
MSMQDLLAAYDEDGRLFFADPEVGMTTSWRTEKEVKGTMTMPNMAAVYTSPVRVQKVQRVDGEPDILAAVGEVKTLKTTDWLFNNVFGNRPNISIINTEAFNEFMGQLVRYMDESYMTYGFYTNYGATVIIHRRTEEVILESPPVF